MSAFAETPCADQVNSDEVSITMANCELCQAPLNPSMNCSLNGKFYCCTQCLAAAGKDLERSNEAPQSTSIIRSCSLF